MPVVISCSVAEVALPLVLHDTTALVPAQAGLGLALKEVIEGGATTLTLLLVATLFNELFVKYRKLTTIAVAGAVNVTVPVVPGAT